MNIFDEEKFVQFITENPLNFSEKRIKTAKDDLGSFIAMGIAGMLFFHMAENIGMTIGLLPITGIPLPFVSYGLTSLLSSYMGMGFVLNVRLQSNKYNLGRV